MTTDVPETTRELSEIFAVAMNIPFLYRDIFSCDILETPSQAFRMAVETESDNSVVPTESSLWSLCEYAYDHFFAPDDEGNVKFIAVAFADAPSHKQAEFLDLIETSMVTESGARVFNFSTETVPHPTLHAVFPRLCQLVKSFRRARDRRRRWMVLRIACFVLMLQTSAVKRVFHPTAYAATLLKEFAEIC